MKNKKNNIYGLLTNPRNPKSSLNYIKNYHCKNKTIDFSNNRKKEKEPGLSIRKNILSQVAIEKMIIFISITLITSLVIGTMISSGMMLKNVADDLKNEMDEINNDIIDSAGNEIDINNIKEEIDSNVNEMGTYDTIDYNNIVTNTLNIRGDINGIIDSEEVETIESITPRIIQVSNNIFAIAYAGDDENGFLKTIEISTNGTIINILIDSLIFDDNKVNSPDIIHVFDNIFAIAYCSGNKTGHLKTFEIANNGNILDSVIDTLEFDSINCKSPDIIPVTGNYFVIAYSGDGDDGFLKTVEINKKGKISDSEIDTLEFDVIYGNSPNILHLSDNYYVIAYTGNDNDGFLKTVEITTDGMITDTIIDTFEFDKAGGKTPNIIHISGNVYVIAYEGERGENGNDGYLTTVEITTNGMITDVKLDTLEFDNSKGKNPNIIHIYGNVYGITYTGFQDKGFLKTVEIETFGQIKGMMIDTMEFDDKMSKNPNIIYVSDDVYALIYSGEDNDGFLKTVEIKRKNVVSVEAPIVSISTISQDIIISWNQVSSVDHYNIYRYSPIYDKNMTSSTWNFDFSNPYMVTDTCTWIDYDACNISNSNFAWKYYYIVRAVDCNGNEEKNFNIIGKTSYHLEQGRNIVHWMGDTVNVKTAFETINGNYDSIKVWDGHQYNVYWADYDYPSDFQLEHDIGYQIYIKDIYQEGVVWTHFENWSIEIQNDNSISSALESPSEFSLSIDEENVQLQWGEVTGAWSYNIYRTTNGTTFDFSSPIENTKKTYWIDYDTNKEKHTNFSTSYHYIVRAVDQDGKEEQNFNAVGKISLYLSPGRNMVRWMGETIGVKEGLKTIEGKYETVQVWNETEYDVYWADYDWPNEFQLEHDIGYLIFIKNDYTNGAVLTYIEQ